MICKSFQKFVNISRWHPLLKLVMLISHLQHHYQLFCGFTGGGRHARCALCNDFQCFRGDIWQMDVRVGNVRYLEQFRCLLLHGQHHASVLHFGGQVRRQLVKYHLANVCQIILISFQVLCHSPATGLSTHNDASSGLYHAPNGLAITGAALVPTHLLGLVHHERELEISQVQSPCKLTIYFLNFQLHHNSTFQQLLLSMCACGRVSVCVCACLPEAGMPDMQFACLYHTLATRCAINSCQQLQVKLAH